MKKNIPVSWANREDSLREIKRYHKFDKMFYRTNLFIHKERVKAIVKILFPYIHSVYPNFDFKKTLLISEYHDDYELVLRGGDIPLQLKLMMSQEKLSVLEEREILAAKKIAHLYKNPKIDEYKYEDILMHAILKDCIEAQTHSFADKIDGYCEAIHEVIAGNIIFLEPIINYQARTFNNLEKKFPLIKELFYKEETENSLFYFPVIDLKSFFAKGNIGARLHTPENIKNKTLIPHYEKWKKVTLATFSDGMDILTRQTEFHI